MLNKEFLVKCDGLKGGGYYVEYCIDDVCLIIEVMKKVVENGVEIFNYIKLEYFIYDFNKKVNGIEVLDMIDGEMYVIKVKKVINVFGFWVDEVRSGDYVCNNK